ncbi:MAG TPA: hypothetical protein VFF33_12115 [Ignavibacteriaceae bacterium]|nr:hypothetical protein [Ignavibacteriaceae bacterium]
MKNVFYFFLIYLFSFQIFLFSQDTTNIVLDGKKYIKENNKWYVEDNSTKQKFLVNTNSITVKLKDTLEINKLYELNTRNKVKIVNKNILGFIDLEFTNKNFFENYNLYKQSNIFDVIEINSYGILLSGTKRSFLSSTVLFK